MTPTFLVTGGSGFIGTWVVRRLLERQFGVVVYDLHDGGERWRQLLGASTEQLTLIRGDLARDRAPRMICTVKRWPAGRDHQRVKGRAPEGRTGACQEGVAPSANTVRPMRTSTLPLTVPSSLTNAPTRRVPGRWPSLTPPCK